MIEADGHDSRCSAAASGPSRAGRSTAACSHVAEPTRWSCSRPRPRSSTPTGSVERAARWFEGLGATATGLPVLNRRDAEADENVAAMRAAKFVYLADGSPLHLRSVLKGSALFDALLVRATSAAR